MAHKLDQEARMAIKKLDEKGVSRCEAARILGVTEGAVRYHLRRQKQDATDGRAKQTHRAAAFHEVIVGWREVHGADGRINLAALHDHLVEEYGYEGSLRSVQRYFREVFPRPRIRARRRVETPPGAQAQVDWAHFPGIVVADEQVDLLAFHLELSHSRFGVIVWSRRKDLLSWLHCHNEGLKRLGGVPATIRVDNEKTAVVHGAGAHGTIHPAYRRYALEARFHVDACAPRQPQQKGKVERRIRDHRLRDDPGRHRWGSLEELQEWTDERVLAQARRRKCPMTGTSTLEAWEAEKPLLGPLPILPDPFDICVTRAVTIDALVAFEGRQYPVPFAYVRKTVEVRGCAGKVQIVADGRILREYPRHTKELILVDSTCYDGPATDEVLPPTPLGRMGRRLQEIMDMEPQQRPLDLYVALAEVAR